MTSRTTVAAALAAAALLVAAPSAFAQAPETVDLAKGGKTTLKLTKKLAKALKKAGITIKGSKGAKNVKGGVSIPISEGEIDPIDGNPAEIDHNGTVTAKLGKKKLALKTLAVELGTKGTLTAKVGNSTVTIANLSGGSAARDGFEATKVSGVNAKLTKAGAKALNKKLGTKAFKKGKALGKATIDAKLAEALIDGAAGGTTTLTIDPNTKALFDSENVSISAVAPGTLPNPTTLVFPITGGKIELASLTGGGPPTGQIQHSGGISFKDADPPQNEVAFSDLFFDIDTTPSVSVLFAGIRVDAADLDVSGASKTVTGSNVQFSGGIAKANAAASGVLQAAPPTGFGMTIPPGTPIGTNATTLTLK